MKSRSFFFILVFEVVLFNALSGQDSLSQRKLLVKQSPVFFTVGYRVPLNKNKIINSGHGLYTEGGINLGRWISKNLVLGLYGGFAFQDRSWSTSFNQNFSDEYGASIKKDQQFSGLDSAVIFSSASLFKTRKGSSITMPGCETNSFHNYSLYYGLIFKLPLKYFPILKIYKGTTRSYYMGDGYIASKQKEFNIFELRRIMYGCEAVIIAIPFKKINASLGLSIYYEHCNFYNSTLYFYDGSESRNIPLQNFINSSFLTKYKNETAWGMKINFNRN